MAKHGYKTFHFSECMSGSGRLSLGCLMGGMWISFPVDFRYGWDLRTKNHRRLLGSVFDNINPLVEFYAPKCSPWSSSQTTTKAGKLQSNRMAEIPTLSWMVERCKRCMKTLRAALIENPRRSDMFKVKESPVSGLCRDQRVVANHSDQCQYGARSAENGIPIKKQTTMQAMGIKIQHTNRTCTGDDRCSEHVQLQGSIPGSSINRTAVSAVYAWGYVASLVQDFIEHLMTGQTYCVDDADLVEDFYTALWACPRCQWGSQRTRADGTVEATPPHSRVRGQCKFPQDGGPPVPSAWKRKADIVPLGGVPLEPDEAGSASGDASSSGARGSAEPALPEPPAPLSAVEAATADPDGIGDDDVLDERSVPPPPTPAPGAPPRPPALRVQGKKSVSFGPGTVPGKHDRRSVKEGVAEPPSFIEPSFDLKNIRKILEDPKIGDDHKRKVLMGLHIKFWHASAQDMKGMLWRANYDNTILALVDSVVKSCRECSAFARSMPKPMMKAALSHHFNDRVQTDLFFIFDKIFVPD